MPGYPCCCDLPPSELAGCHDLFVPRSFQLTLADVALVPPHNPFSGSECESLGGQPCVDLEGTYLVDLQFPNQVGPTLGTIACHPADFGAACGYNTRVNRYLCDNASGFGNSLLYACWFGLTLFRNPASWGLQASLFVKGYDSFDPKCGAGDVYQATFDWVAETGDIDVTAINHTLTACDPQPCQDGFGNSLSACDPCAFNNSKVHVVAA